MAGDGNGGRVDGGGATPASPASIDALWIETLQRLSAAVAHELRGALNGVSVNLEVVRSRSERPDTAASAVTTFATAASGQLESVIAMADGLLALARPPRDGTPIAQVVKHVAALLGPAASADGRTLELETGFESLPATSAPGNAVRLAIGAALLAGMDVAPHVRCSALAASGDGVAVLRIEGRDGIPMDVGPHVVAAVATAGIHMSVEPSAVSIQFPR